MLTLYVTRIFGTGLCGKLVQVRQGIWVTGYTHSNNLWPHLIMKDTKAVYLKTADDLMQATMDVNPSLGRSQHLSRALQTALAHCKELYA